MRILGVPAFGLERFGAVGAGVRASVGEGMCAGTWVQNPQIPKPSRSRMHQLRTYIAAALGRESQSSQLPSHEIETSSQFFLLDQS